MTIKQCTYPIKDMAIPAVVGHSLEDQPPHKWWQFEDVLHGLGLLPDELVGLCRLVVPRLDHCCWVIMADLVELDEALDP